MCEACSMLVLPDLTVRRHRTDAENHSHTEQAESWDMTTLGTDRCSRVEVKPRDGDFTTDPSGWDVNLDEKRKPIWWDENLPEIEGRCRSEAAKWWKQCVSPAGKYVERSSERVVYKRNGQRHRMDGPAVKWADGYAEWWLNGKKIPATTKDRR